jgi:hypothetical protein
MIGLYNGTLNAAPSGSSLVTNHFSLLFKIGHAGGTIAEIAGQIKKVAPTAGYADAAPSNPLQAQLPPSGVQASNSC